MTINNKILELVSELEYIIGNETTHKSTFFGPFSCVDDYEYRYPVHICLDMNGHERDMKIDGKLHNGITMQWFDEQTKEQVVKNIKPTPEKIDTMYYAFGSHRLYIGDALVKVLEFLENRYGIDFKAMEEKLPVR